MDAAGFELSLHALSMLAERSIEEAWLWLALNEPDRILDPGDGNCIMYAQFLPSPTVSYA